MPQEIVIDFKRHAVRRRPVLAEGVCVLESGRVHQRDPH